MTPSSASTEAATVGDILARFSPAGLPSADIRRRRQRLADFVRSAESRVFRANDAAREELRELLGWDDDSLSAFVTSSMVVHSATHVSMNAFPPMLTFPWFCQRLIAAAHPARSSAAHLRTQVTHNNLSDSRWKPHIWWRVTAGGELVRTQLYSRGPKYEHQILLGQPSPETPDDLCDADADCVALARHATNFAYFAMIYRMAVERSAGLHAPHPTIEVPIDLMNAYTLSDDAIESWGRAMREMRLPLRRIGPDNELHEVADPESVTVDPLDARASLICPNSLNVGQAYRLGLSVTMGAEKMTQYLDDMNDVIIDFRDRIGEEWRIPQFLGVSRVDLDDLAPLPPEWRAELKQQQGKPSLPLLAAHYGASFTDRLDHALAHPVGSTIDMVTQTWNGHQAAP